MTTGEEMFAAVSEQLGQCDVLVMCAAVCDYRPAQVRGEKISRSTVVAFPLSWKQTRDILASLTNKPNSCFVVGFAAETHDLEANAERKLREKNCDLIVANDVSRHRHRNGCGGK